MRRWWKTMGVLAGSMLSFGGWLSSASAQFPPPPGGMGMPPGGMGMPPGAVGMMPPPGTFGGNPPPAMPTEFPNAAPPSGEPATPFSIKDEGMPNAFTTLVDPRLRRNDPYVLTLRAEYLGWWVSRGPTNAVLVTTTNNLGGGEVGAQGEPNTVNLVPAGRNTVDYPLTQGFRMSMGIAIGYLPPIEISGFAINRNWTVFGAGSTDATGLYLARPVQLADTPVTPINGFETVEFVNIPGIAAGSVHVVSKMSLWGVDANALFELGSSDVLHVDFLMGYRHTDLYESLEISNTLIGTNGNVNFNGTSFPTGFSTSVLDRFRTRNSFDGGQIGLKTVLTGSKFSLFGDIKLAMGVTNQNLLIEGASTVNNSIAGRSGQSLDGGILALKSNSGTNSAREFSIIPEANLTLSYQINPRMRFFGGYSVMYWSNVIRPGDHITNVVDSRQIPTDANFNPNVNGIAPGFPAFVNRNFWAHGFNIGLEFGF